MTGEDFTAWMAHMKFRKADAAEALGLGRNTVPRYMEEGAPLYIALACTALAQGMPAWRKIGAGAEMGDGQ